MYLFSPPLLFATVKIFFSITQFKDFDFDVPWYNFLYSSYTWDSLRFLTLLVKVFIQLEGFLAIIVVLLLFVLFPVCPLLQSHLRSRIGICATAH